MAYLNLNQLTPEPQILEIGERKFDISKASSRTTSRLLQVGSENAKFKGDDSKQYDVYVAEMEALVAVLGNDQDGNPATLEWVLENTSNAQFQAVIKFITSCLSGKEETVAEGETPANFTPNREMRRAGL